MEAFLNSTPSKPAPALIAANADNERQYGELPVLDMDWDSFASEDLSDYDFRA